MALWSTIGSIGDAFGLWERRLVPVGCELGRRVFRETKRSAQIANFRRATRPLRARTIQRLQPVFPYLDLHGVRIRTRCRLPSNRFRESGSIYAMTFGTTIYWRDTLDEDDPGDLVKLMHELVHVDQVRRHGGEAGFACEYGKGYLEGGGGLPAYINNPTAYHRNPLEAEAYSFEAQFRDDGGRVALDRLPDAPGQE